MQTRVPCGRVRVIGLWPGTLSNGVPQRGSVCPIRQTGATGDGERQDPSFMICFLDGVMQLSITEVSHRAPDFLTGHVIHYILPPLPPFPRDQSGALPRHAGG